MAIDNDKGGFVEDQTDLFAQLARLHAQGLLTDAEYEDKKAALVAKIQESALPSSVRPGAAPSEATKHGPLRNTRVWMLVIFVPLAIIGIYSLARTADSSSAGSGSTDAASVAIGSDSGPWTIESTTDPMTDAAVKSAKATFEGSQFNIEVAVSCATSGALSYTAASFDKAGKPVEMRSSASQYGARIPFQVRADDGKPISQFSPNPQYNNQIVLEWVPGSSRFDFLTDAGTLASAQRVILRLFMLSGEETVTLPQDSAGFRGVVDSCLQQQPSPTPSATPAPVAAAESSDAGSFADASSEGANDAVSKRERDKLCDADVLYEVASIENPSSKMEAGTTFDTVTQFWRNKQTGETRFCQHGGYCYPSHVVVSGRKVEAIRLRNCSVGKQGEDDGEDILYYVR